ncbi:MAG TPA: carbonic anhydrase [Candidatus Binataceae bacterium]|jgi:carbonic anhydrase|nr:carbonic anhydrase [Candidatus Binataceae bacterium]
MSIIDEALKANETYARNFKLASQPIPPAKKLAIVACMDARLTIEPMLGLSTGEAHIIRNAGGIVTEDAIRSLLISHYLLGTQEFMVINHTDCGMLTFKDSDLLARLEREKGVSVLAPSHFHTFENLEANVRRQVGRIRSHHWIPKELPVRGFIYDVKSGKLNEVKS